MIKKITLIFILFILYMNKTYAVCTKEIKDEFEKIKEQYNITSEFNIENKTYNLILEREKPDVYDYYIEVIELTGIYNPNEEIECLNPNDKISKCINFPSGTYKVKIVGQTTECNNTLEETVIELAKYNEYSEDILCEGLEEFVLCQPTYDKEIDYDTFVSRVNTYKKTKQEKLEEEKIKQEKERKNKIINTVTEYIEENLVQIIIAIIFIILVTISSILGIKSIRKSRRLE